MAPRNASMFHRHDLDAPVGQHATLQLLRGLGVHVDPVVRRLEERLTAPEAEHWVASTLAAPAGAGELEILLRDAMHRASAIATGAIPIPASASTELIREVWALLLEKVPTVAGDVPAAIAACLDASPELRGQLAEERHSLGSYELLEILGEGASGTVFRGRHRDNGSFAAIKVLRVANQDSSLVARFRQEAKLAAQLDHPAIVAVRDSGVERHAGLATPYIAYELVRGRPFTAALSGAPVARILTVFARLCEAIDYAHQCGILHRDIKSANVLVDAEDRPHVLDFGIARPGEQGDRSMTRTGEVLGTPASMSPEQAAGSRVDVRADVYALGALLFETLAGESPHRLDGLSSQQALGVVANTPARSLARVMTGASSDLVAVVDTALAFAANERYRTVADLLGDVKRLQAGQPVLVSRPTAWHLLRLFARRHQRVAALVLASVLIVLVTATSLFLAWRQSVALVVATRAAEQAALAGAARNLQTMRNFVQFAGPMVEEAPTSGERYDQLVAMLAQTIGTATEGDPASLQVLANLHELAGDLALRGGRLADSRSHREVTAALLERTAAVGGACALEHARALVKLGDLDLEAAPATAKALFEKAHAVFVAAATGPEASIAACDELGWSHERLAALAWKTGARAEAFAIAKQRLSFVEDLLQRQPDGARQYHLASALASLCVYALEGPAESGIDVASRRDLAGRASVAAQAAVAQHPRRLPYQDLAIKANCYYGRDCMAMGEVAAARTAFERAVALAEGLAAQDPGSAIVQSLAVWAHQDLATCLVELDELQLAEQECRQAVMRGERVVLLGGLPDFTESHVNHFRKWAAELAVRRAAGGRAAPGDRR